MATQQQKDRAAKLDGDPLWEKFWERYPRKEGKKLAKIAWVVVGPSEELCEQICAAVEAHKKTFQWMKSDGQFIPLPATFLNNERWTDEIKPNKGMSNISIVTRNHSATTGGKLPLARRPQNHDTKSST